MFGSQRNFDSKLIILSIWRFIIFMFDFKDLFHFIESALVRWWHFVSNNVNCDHVCHNQIISVNSRILSNSGSSSVDIITELYIFLEEFSYLLHIDSWICFNCNIFSIRNKYYYRLCRNIAIVLFFIDVIQLSGHFYD